MQERTYMSDTEVKEFFDILASTSSTNEKKALLAKKRFDENVGNYLDYLLNPFFVTGISSAKINKPAVIEPTRAFNDFHELMTYIRKNNTGSDIVLANIQGFLEDADEDLRNFYKGIITKSIRLGCDAKTVNRVFYCEFIPIWEVQQAYQIGNIKLADNEWFSLSQKLNGVRGTYYEGKIISRQGKEFTGLDHIIDDISNLFDLPDMWVLDGELIRNNVNDVSDNENFRLTTGILSQDDSEDKNSIQFVIFDILPKDEFLRGKSILGYKMRMKNLLHLKDTIEKYKLKNVAIVDILYSGIDQSKIEPLLDQMALEGKEGLMLNRDCAYLRKRHSGIAKIKRFYTVDLEIVDFEEGTGRLTGMLGAFVVRYKSNILKVGSGLTDKQRREYWDIKEDLLHRVIEVKYKEESRDARTRRSSLQFPIFVQLREEGKEVSYD